MTSEGNTEDSRKLRNPIEGKAFYERAQKCKRQQAQPHDAAVIADDGRRIGIGRYFGERPVEEQRFVRICGNGGGDIDGG